MDKRGGGVSRFSVEYFLSHSIEKLRGGTLLFQKNSGIEKLKNFMDKWGEEGGSKYHDFPSNFFCVTVIKNFVGKPLSVSLISGIERCKG